MEAIVAIAIKVESGEDRFFLTWGRIFDNIDGSRLEALAMQAAVGVNLGGKPIRAQLCESLQEATGARYFYECFFEMAQRPIPHGPQYDAWKAERAAAMTAGREWYYLGQRIKADAQRP